jgi:hypothetical protein
MLSVKCAKMPQIFANPAVLLAFYDPLFWSGEHKIYDWQIRIQQDFADKLPGKATHIAVAAANGSGKSKYLIGPAAVWTSLFQEALAVITSSSQAQLDGQTFLQINKIANHINKYHGVELFDCKYQFLEFKPTKSLIRGRVTNETGKLEGFHPLEPGRDFSIFVDEAKTIPEDMYDALLRWTGYNRRMDVSSTGPPFGTFYRNFVSGKWKSYRIQAKDCPHITQEEIDRVIAACGEKSPVVQSSIYSIFSDFFDGSLMLSYESVARCIRMGKEGAIPWRQEPENRCGLDPSGGGDEMILSVWNGNKQLAIEPIDSNDHTIAADKIIERLRFWKLNNPKLRKSDGGGNAKGLLDILNRKGWPFIRVFNQVPPVNSVVAKSYANRGTELWYKFAHLVQDCRLILIDDSTQTNQLSNRHLKRQVSSNKMMLEPKPEARANGHPSPDRADAAVLAEDGYVAEEDKPKVEETKRKSMTVDELIDHIDRINDRDFQLPDDGNPLSLEDLVGMRKSSEVTSKLLHTL